MAVGILTLFLFVVIWLLSAVCHERDMARNFQRYGDARGWFYEIRIPDAR